MVAIRQQFVDAKRQAEITWGRGSKMLGVAIHETGNKSMGADAAAHANLQSRGNVRQASWGWTVDDTEAVQSFPNDVRTWHATRAGEHYVSIEICVNPDGDYEKAVQNAAELVRYLRTQGVGRAITNHHLLTGKNCPTQLLAGAAGGFAGFVARANGAPAPAPAPAKPAKLKEDGYEGDLTLEAMQLAIGSANPDGKLSSPSNFTRSLQRFLNDRGFRDYDGQALKVDGHGHRRNVPSTVITRTRTDYAFQQYLETTVEGRRTGYVGDGLWGRPSAGVRIVQVELNAGRLFR